jgi:hypothetical protein
MTVAKVPQKKQVLLIQFDFGVVVSLTFTPYLIIFIFEHFSIGSKVNLCPAVAAILDFGLSQTVHECSLDGPLQTLCFLVRYEIQNGGYGRP